MKRIYLLVLIALCFVFIVPNQTFSSTLFKKKEVKIKITNCQLNKTTILANKIEFKVKRKTHTYNVIGENIAGKTYPFKFNEVTEEFIGVDLDNILNTIITNINNGVVVGYGKDNMGFEYEWKAQIINPIYKTYNIQIEIEED